MCKSVQNSHPSSSSSFSNSTDDRMKHDRIAQFTFVSHFKNNKKSRRKLRKLPFTLPGW